MIFSSQMLPFVTCQWRLLVESLYLNHYVYLLVNQNMCCFLLIGHLAELEYLYNRVATTHDQDGQLFSFMSLTG